MRKKQLCPICGEQSGGGTFLCLGCDQWVHPKCGGYTKSEVQATGKTAAKNELVSWWFAASMVVCGCPRGSPGVSVACLLASTMSVGVYRGLRVSAGVSTGHQVVYQGLHVVCGSLRDSTDVYGSPNEFVGTQQESTGISGSQRVLSGGQQVSAYKVVTPGIWPLLYQW